MPSEASDLKEKRNGEWCKMQNAKAPTPYPVEWGGERRMKNSELRSENALLPQANSCFSILNSSFCIHPPDCVRLNARCRTMVNGETLTCTSKVPTPYPVEWGVNAE